jgi:cation diffusion facilitator family transporter
MASTESKSAIIAGICANLAIAVTKAVAAVITGSSAMIAETIHSVVDAGDAALIWIGVHRSQRGPDAQHPFGHGQELYFWIVVVAVLVFAVGGGMSIYEGVTHLLHPQPIRDAAWSYAVIGIAFVFEGISWVFAWRGFRKEKGRRGIWETIQHSKDPSSFAILFEDSAALLGLLAALAGVFLSERLGSPTPDGIASVVVGTILMVVAVLLAQAARRLVIGQSADPALIERIRAAVLTDPAATGTARVVTVHFGPDTVVANVEVCFRGDLPPDQVAVAIERIHQRVKEAQPQVKHVFIEAEAAKATAA